MFNRNALYTLNDLFNSTMIIQTPFERLTSIEKPKAWYTKLKKIAKKTYLYYDS